ncbi:MAG: RluA family pseudouridine synthase [Planctomycetia bacterium]|nr:RluA family pseudouridine synthase [Planctomycetia bacterium]
MALRKMNDPGKESEIAANVFEGKGEDPEKNWEREEPLEEEYSEEEVLSSEENVTQQRVVEQMESGWRLDQFLPYHFSDYSRVLMRNAIMEGRVRVDGGMAKPSYRLKPGQVVQIILPELPRQAPVPEPIHLEILYEDDWLVAVNKPPGMVAHPARGHWSGTLASALQYRYAGQLSALGGPCRPGIVHRLDRDTSGVILVARHDVAHAKLAAQFESRTIEKEYYAISYGESLRDRDWIDAPIGPHTHSREKKMVRFDSPEARPARTFYEVDEKFDGFTAFRVFPKTGRTHQIRLHLAHIGNPVAGDALYSSHHRILLAELGRERNTALYSEETGGVVVLKRQALHARRIRFTHPKTGQQMEVEAPLAADISEFRELLRKYRAPK